MFLNMLFVLLTIFLGLYFQIVSNKNLMQLVLQKMFWQIKTPMVKVKLLPLIMYFLLVQLNVSVVIMVESACQNSFDIKHEFTPPYSPHQMHTAERS